MFRLKLTIVLFTISQSGTGAVNFGITHWNDISAQIESFIESKTYNSSAPIPCHEDGSDDSKCVGGLVNMINWLNKTKNTPYEGLVDPKNIFRINSGNFIGGESGWFSNMEEFASSLSWKKFGELLIYQYEPDAVAFGSKEFGAGLTETLKFIPDESLWDDITIAPKFLIPANTCKLTYNDTTRESKFCSYNKTLILNVYDSNANLMHEVGVISFIPPAVQRLSFPGALDFSDISTSIQEEIDKKHANTTTFIAIGEGNLAIAQDILDKVPQVKLVIYSSGFEDTDTSGNYPKKHGKKFIATAGKYGSSVGQLVFDLDPETGDITLVKEELSVTKHFTPLLPQALAAVGEFSSFHASINKTAENTFGRTSVSLKGGKTCWNEECNLGNLVADAMVHCTLKTLETFKYPPTFPVHSIWDGGAFYESSIKRGDTITQYDIGKWVPYQNEIRLVKIKGSNLMKVFNISASGIQPKNSGTKDVRQFLQVSNGIEVYYSTKPVPRVTRARMIHDDNQLGDTRLKDLNDTMDYYLAIPAFVYEGKGAYEEAKSYWIDVSFPVNQTQTHMIAQDNQCLISYITSLNYVTTGIDERIWIDEENHGSGDTNIPGDNSDKDKNHAGHSRNTAVTVVLTIVYFVIIEAVIYIGYFKVLPKLRKTGSRTVLQERYPPNQL